MWGFGVWCTTLKIRNRRWIAFCFIRKWCLTAFRIHFPVKQTHIGVRYIEGFFRRIHIERIIQSIRVKQLHTWKHNPRLECQIKLKNPRKRRRVGGLVHGRCDFYAAIVDFDVELACWVGWLDLGEITCLNQCWCNEKKSQTVSKIRHLDFESFDVSFSLAQCFWW